MKQNRSEIAVITVNYNGLETTALMLQSLFAALAGCPYSFRVWVVDNGSVNDEAAVLAKRFPEITAIRSEENRGFAGGNNLALTKTDADFILLLNNDIIVRNDFISPLIRRFQQDDRIGMVSPKILDYETGTIQFAGYTTNKLMTRITNPAFGKKNSEQFSTAIQTPFAHGAALMIRKSVIDRIGPMSLRYFLYFEELDWSVKTIRAGYRIWMEPDAQVLHHGSRTVGGLSPLKIYYNTRNRLIFAREVLPARTAWRSFAFQLFFSLPKNCIRYMRHGQIRLIGPAIRGAIDFLRGKEGYAPYAHRSRS